MYDILKIVATLIAVKYFVIQPLNVSGQLNNPAVVTALVCSAIVFITVVLSISLNKRR